MKAPLVFAMLRLLCGTVALAADNAATNAEARNHSRLAPLNLTNVTPAEVDAFRARWWPEIQTNGLLGIGPMLDAETNMMVLSAKLLGTLDREPQSIWVFMLQIVAEPPQSGREGVLSPAQSVAVWKQACAILEKWLQAPDPDLGQLELHVAQQSQRQSRPAAELEKSLRTEDPHNNIARTEISAGLDMARQDLSLTCLAAGKEYLVEAKTLARQLLAGNTATNWNYGNIVYDAHSLLGRIALRQADRATARDELRAAGRTPGSPQLDSFGPQFDLARELLNGGDTADREAVVAFLDDIAKFWANPDKAPASYKEDAVKKQQQIEAWKTDIRAGQIPKDPNWR